MFHIPMLGAHALYRLKNERLEQSDGKNGCGKVSLVDMPTFKAYLFDPGNCKPDVLEEHEYH